LHDSQLSPLLEESCYSEETGLLRLGSVADAHRISVYASALKQVLAGSSPTPVLRQQVRKAV